MQRFNELASHLLSGREIEFAYNGKQYSITNSKGRWMLYCDTDKLLLKDICDFEHVKSYRYYEQFKHKAVEVSAVEKGSTPGRVSDEERILAYCGGIALHDVYAAYKIYNLACERGVGTDVDMQLPTTRFWIEP